MANWRESGEVPDSEDDDFDSQGTDQPSLPQNLQRSIPSETPTPVKDIWDIPSSQDDGLTKPDSPTPQPSEELPVDSPLPILPPSGSVCETQPSHDISNPPPSSSILSEAPSLDSHQDNLDQGDALPRDTPSPLRPGHPPPLPSQILGHDPEELLAVQRLAVSHERSLRTRKPEQLRPYQTERARFNSEWRQHGLRPVRIVNDADRPHPDGDESLEEAEFQPETQESAPQHVLDAVSSSQISMDPPNDRNPSSQLSTHDDTDNTTLDGEELPSLAELMSRRHRLNSKRKAKHGDFRSSKGRKRDQEPGHEPGADDGRPKFIIPAALPDPRDSSRTGSRSKADSRASRPAASPKSDGSSQTTPRQYNHPSRVPQGLVMTDDNSTEVVDPFESSEQSELEDGNVVSSGASESESDVVNQNSRRIKGVLPASWLRLDQKSSRSKLQKKVTRRPLDTLHSVDNRRGVARPGVARPKEASSVSNADNFMFEESEEEGPVISNEQEQDMRVQTILEVENVSPMLTHEISSDDESVIEHDYIEPLLASRKRQLKLPDAFKGQQKRQRVSKSATGVLSRPTERSKRGSSSLHTRYQGEPRRKSNARGKHKNPNATRHAKAIRRGYSPPRLSILDVIEPDAPRFLRIAARTVKGRQDCGRSSPVTKTIQLATRKDHIDATTVLRDWTSGSIRQRPSVSVARQPKPASSGGHGPFKSTIFKFSSRLGNESIAKQPSNRLTKIKRTTIISLNKHQRNDPPKSPRETKQLPKFPRSYSSQARLAQLEVDNGPETAGSMFHSGKKALDFLYQGHVGENPETGSVLSLGMRHAGQLPSFSPTLDPISNSHQPRMPQNRRRRKRTKPLKIDIEAPQYSRANDPLPSIINSTSDVPTIRQINGGAKLFGLGPYGTQYTHHFEVFPLHSDVFFDDSSLLGSGIIETATKTDYGQSLRVRKQEIAFTLDGETFQWGEWTSQVSSELGLLLDHIVDQIEPQNSMPNRLNDGEAIAGVAYLLSYVSTAISFTAESDSRSFLCRILEVIQNFNTRITSIIESNVSLCDSLLQPIAQVLDHILVILYLCRQIGRIDPCLVREQFSMENLLKSTSGIAIRILLQTGPHRIRQFYSDMDRPSRRGRFGVNDFVLHSWIVTMKVLEVAQIPQASFWVLFQRAILPPALLSSVEVGEYEQVWNGLFVLLPLTEFNNVGRLVPGQRHRISSDGWSLPQQLLKRIFHLYQENKHQSPGFNDYCRALIGRCHYLVEQWGWHKCASIVGVIFDFFGSQSLSHLRNEEAYSSPQFLEELGYQPSLCIEREDRCFHIFLKLIALGLQKLRTAGSLKDIRNLVARVVPNHNRQYLKEQNIHERDLAALRNHHDLLCTLFWASPAELRPNVNLIQGLIAPANSHKAACLINLRAWSQLSRFIVISGEATTSLRPFNAWRSSFFQQVMEQYESVALDIEQQLQSLSKDVTKSISSEMVNAMISWNKTAVTDVLYTCGTVSLEVIQRAPDLEAALFCLGTRQLQQVLIKFSSASPGLDWPILRTCLLTLEIFLNRIDEFKANEQSQESESQILNSALADDALQVLSHDIASQFFSMTYCVMSARDEKRSVGQTQCVELAVTLAARLGMRLSEAGSLHLLDLFKPGGHGPWRSLPHDLSLNLRKYLPIFVATLLRHGFSNWSEEGLLLIELWLISVVKPREAFGYEKEFAKQLIYRGEIFVPSTAERSIGSINYEVNRQFLQNVVSSMRRSIRDAEPGLKRSLQLEHGTVLKRIMLSMKKDLKIVLRDANEHQMYMDFVRPAIALIKTHASDFCPVDDFFYQVNQEYSPPQQDPQLQAATLISYGIRLADGDMKVEHPLFFFLLNQLKLAVMGDRMCEEAILLYKGMQTNGILRFILGKMFPAIVQVSLSENVAALPMVDIYTYAFRLLLEKDGQMQLVTIGHIEEIQILLKTMIRSIRGLGPAWPSSEELHLARQYLGFMNAVWPSLYVMALSPHTSEVFGTYHISDTLRLCREWTSVAEAQLRSGVQDDSHTWDVDSLFPSVERPLEAGSGDQPQVGVSRLAESIVTDIRKNWVTLGDRLTIQAPGQQRGTQSTQARQGVQKPRWDLRDLVVDLYERVHEWNHWWDRMFGMGLTGEMSDLEKSHLPLF